jgi:hypothetical protein
MSLGACLKKSCLSLFIAGLVLVSVNISGAQVLPSIPGVGNLELGSVKVVPFAQVGYKNIGFSFNLPVSISAVFDPTRTFALDLSFRDAGVWVGSIGFDARLLSTFFVSLRADGNATKNIQVFAAENWGYYGYPVPFTWRGSQLQWWDIDGMAGYDFCKDWSVVAGLRYDKLTVGLRDPVDATGRPLPISIGSADVSITGDVTVKTWIPYIGLQLNTGNYKALLVYSPFASPEVIAPQNFLQVIRRTGELFEQAGFVWQFTKTGSFLEGYFEYNMPIRESLQLGLWARGTWTRFSGDGSWDGNHIDDVGATLAESLSATGTLSTYGLSGGVAASLSF